ncbi:MAG: ATP-binding protein [Solirubrobacteraceae bacterium MAG38_C4-C5]|nr:ATP-binding protein [Candidatus Siliceabacter maunaloa]
MDSSEDPIIGLTLEGVITDWNPAAQRLYGYSCEEALGASIAMLVPPELRGSTNLLARVGAGEVLRQVDTQRMAKDGERIDVSISMSPIRDERHAIVGAAAFTRDNRVHKQTEAMLERQRRQLAEAQSVGGFGSWEWDMGADTVEWSEQLCRIYGLEPGRHPVTFEGCLQRIHPDDRARVQADAEAAYARGTPFSLEHRIVRPDGGVRTLHARGEVATGEHGTALRMLGTGQDITERREIERAKDEFTSVVSHELRTPLTSIRGSLGLLESGVLGELPERGRRMVRIAAENSDRLVRLINDILDIERIGSGKIDMQPQRCDAAELVERALESVGQIAAQAQVSVSADTQPVTLGADPDRVLQTLTNLLSNALKFSPAGTAVLVCSGRRGGEVLFQVSDEGRGIPADKLDSIFQRFQQVDASDSREMGGTGLGLAICRAIVEQHGGRIWAESELGKGSTFSFTLPALVEREPAPAPTTADGAPAVVVCEDERARVPA